MYWWVTLGKKTLNRNQILRSFLWQKSPWSRIWTGQIETFFIILSQSSFVTLSSSDKALFAFKVPSNLFFSSIYFLQTATRCFPSGISIQPAFNSFCPLSFRTKLGRSFTQSISLGKVIGLNQSLFRAILKAAHAFKTPSFVNELWIPTDNC